MPALATHLSVCKPTPTPAHRPSPKVTRRKFVARWVQIWDELDALADDIAAAPRGTFNQDERVEALMAIQHYAFIALVNKRPSMVRRRV